MPNNVYVTYNGYGEKDEKHTYNARQTVIFLLI